MNPKAKTAIKIIGISLGALTLTGVGVYLYLKNKRDPSGGNYAQSDSPSSFENTSGNHVAANPYSKYSTTEVRKMQQWLYWKGLFSINKTILDAIAKSGGIDGKIGPGFITALNEAIKKGYVTSIDDLFNKANK